MVSTVWYVAGKVQEYPAAPMQIGVRPAHTPAVSMQLGGVAPGGAGESSVVPSQSSSTPLQVSAIGPTNAPPQTSAPPVQATVPKRQRPTLLGPQRTPVPAIIPLSAAPSQSSSTALHVSGVGPRPPRHVSAPSTQARRPGSQAPADIPQAVPSIGSASSTAPLQSSSRPLQVSAPVGVHMYSQPVIGLPSMSSKPASQVAMPHMPPMHDSIACGKEQVLPQVPQCAGSVSS